MHTHLLIEQAITPGVIAEALGQPLRRVINILATRPHIKPMARAGIIRLYRREAVSQVRYEINLIDAKREAVRSKANA